MAAIPTIDRIAAKWAEVTPQRAPQYEAGVREPLRDWQREAAAANGAWKEGVSAAVSQDLFIKGVNRAGTAKWQRGAIDKGVGRFGPGVQLAEQDFASGFGPFREAIARVALPPRFARRDPRNLARNKAIVDALIAVKKGGASSS